MTAPVPSGCFYLPSCVVRPERPVQQNRSVSAFTRAARYTELTEKQPTVFEMKEITTVLKRNVGTVVTGCRLHCTHQLYSCFGHLPEWVQQDGTSAVMEIPSGPPAHRFLL